MAKGHLGATSIAAVVLALVSTGWVGGADAGGYLETFDQGKDPASVFDGALTLGERNDWTGTLEGGAYRLQNTSRSGAIRYHYLLFSNPVEALKVKVAGHYVGDRAAAGLIYGFDVSRKHYFAFLVTKNGRYLLLQRDDEGFNRIAAGSNEAIKTSGVNLLEVRFEGPSIHHFSNGERLVTTQTQRTIADAVGIVAVDIGNFIFDDFAISTQ